MEVKINKYVTLIVDDCVKSMKLLKNNSVDLIVTSPPYWGQRDYKNANQWGNEKDVKEYITKMTVWGKECFRVLRNTGTLFLNIGDKYSKKGLNLIPERIAIAFTDTGWCLRNTIIWYKPNHMPTSVKDRFCNTYEYIYFFVKDSGKYYNYNYYSDIDRLRILNEVKPSEGGGLPKKPSRNQDKWPQTLSIEDYEMKWKKKVEQFNIEKKKNYKGKFTNETINMGTSPGARQSQGILYSLQRKTKVSKQNSLKINEFLLKYFKKSNKSTKDIDNSFDYKDTASHWFRLDPGRSIPKPEIWFQLKNILNIEDPQYDDIMTQTHYVLQNVKNNPKGKNPGDFWSIATTKCKESHYAVFPTELPRKIISAFCPEEGLVLDPFGGSGTTGIAAQNLKRRCLLIDCNPDFEAIIRKRCNTCQ